MSRLNILVIVLVTVLAGWRVYETEDSLRQARADLVEAEDRFRGLEEVTEHQLAALADRARDLERELRQTRRDLEDRQPCDGYPRLILSPASGPPETRVNFVGYCFVGNWGFKHNDRSGLNLLSDGYGLFIINPAQDLSDPDRPNSGPGCELIGTTHPHDLVIRANGTARGYLTIPTSGACFQQARRVPLTPGLYHIGLSCHACFPFATFRVTD